MYFSINIEFGVHKSKSIPKEIDNETNFDYEKKFEEHYPNYVNQIGVMHRTMEQIYGRVEALYREKRKLRFF